MRQQYCRLEEDLAEKVKVHKFVTNLMAGMKEFCQSAHFDGHTYSTSTSLSHCKIVERALSQAILVVLPGSACLFGGLGVTSWGNRLLSQLPIEVWSLLSGNCNTEDIG